MILADHLEELRRRLGVCLIGLLLGVGLSAAYVPRLLSWLQRPIAPFVSQFAVFSPTEPLLAYVKVAGLAGLLLAMPVMLWQGWAFIRTGLTRRERGYGLAFVLWGSVLFLAGAAFAYLVLLPLSLRALLSIGADVFEPVMSIDRYLSFATALLFWCGLIFELPVILVVLAKIGLVTPAWLRQQRPYAVLVLVIIAAVVTPTTDPVSLFLMALPLMLLYEVSIVMTRWAMPSRPEQS